MNQALSIRFVFITPCSFRSMMSWIAWFLMSHDTSQAVIKPNINDGAVRVIHAQKLQNHLWVAASADGAVRCNSCFKSMQINDGAVILVALPFFSFWFMFQWNSCNRSLIVNMLIFKDSILYCLGKMYLQVELALILKVPFTMVKLMWLRPMW